MVCDHCQKEIEVSRETTMVFVFLETPQYSHARITCDNGDCAQVYHLLADQDDLAILLDEEKQLKVFTEHEAPLHIRAAFNPYIKDEATQEEVEAIQEFIETMDQPLTPSQEKLLAKLRQALDELPSEWVMEVFSSPPPRSQLPRKWI